MRLHRFQSRILLFFLTLFFLVLVISNVLVGLANSRNAHEMIDADLKTASRIFLRLMDTRKHQLADSARLLSGDYAFKTAFATGDRDTISSALANHQARIGADMMMMVSSDRKLIVSANPADGTDIPFKYGALIEAAEDKGEAYSLLELKDATYQAVVVPLLAPAPVAWILLGFKINDATVLDFKKLSNLEVSFCAEGGGRMARCFASTFPEQMRGGLSPIFNAGLDAASGETMELPIMGDIFISLKIEIGKTPDGKATYAILQRSLTQLMRPFRHLQQILLLIAGIGLLSSAVAGVLVAKSVTKPVKALVEGVGRVQKGDYTRHVPVDRMDEIGTLAIAINQMTDGLAEKDRVRALLGKVVSHAVAEELLSKNVELGGEECEVTVLFSDIRSFTTFSEFRTPKEVLTFLNIYFTRMSAIVEAHGGVVDKYIGDAIMALFGAPLKHGDDADRALLTAIEMVEALEGINRELEQRGMPPLDMGIGINTGTVVVGNMGSEDRLNYTAIGDGVNLASRLQTLTKEKEYRTKILISEQTLGKAKGTYTTRPLGQVAIKGKSQPIAIYALLGRDRSGDGTSAEPKIQP